MRSNIVISVAMVLVIIVATLMINENKGLEDLGYPDEEISLINEKGFSDDIISNEISYDSFSHLKSQLYYDEEYLEQYCSLLNRVYTEDDLEIVTAGIKAYVDKYGLADTLSFTKDNRVKESIETALKPRITVSRKVFPPTLENEGEIRLKPYVSANSYFDGNITEGVKIWGFLDTSKEGVYTVNIEAYDSRGYRDVIDVDIVVRVLETKELDNPDH